jgi:hypothetical protein
MNFVNVMIFNAIIKWIKENPDVDPIEFNEIIPIIGRETFGTLY